MILKFSNDFCTACKPIAWIWHKGNDPIGCCPVAIIVVVDVHLPEIHAMFNSPEHLTITILLTVLAVLNILLLATKW